MINLALIGIGKWGRNYLSTIKAFPNCRIKYLCSSTAANLQEYKDDYVVTTDFKELFKYQDIDGVIISTPGPTHYKIAKEFLKRGFNLLIEKPLTTNYQDSLKLKILADKISAKILVGHVYLFDPAYLKAKELLSKIGPIKFISYQMMGNKSNSSDISLLWEYGPHAISLLLDIYKKDPTQIQGWAKPSKEECDEITLKLKFPDQTEPFVKLSWSSIKKRELTLICKKGSLIYNDLQLNRLTLIKDVGANIKKTYPAYNHQLPLDAELNEFIEAIEKNQDLARSNLDFGIKVTKILHLAEQSIKNKGEAVNVSF